MQHVTRATPLAFDHGAIAFPLGSFAFAPHCREVGHQHARRHSMSATTSAAHLAMGQVSYGNCGSTQLQLRHQRSAFA